MATAAPAPASARHAEPGRARLSRDAIVDAARRLLDEGGADALSMRAVAEALGSSPMALYRYVADKRDLEIAAARSVSGEVALDDGDDVAPDAAIGTWMREVRAHWLRHPWFGHLLGQHPELGDFLVAIGDNLARALKRAGADDRLAGEELIRITRTTLGVVLIEQASPLAGRREWTVPIAPAGPASDIARAVASYDDDQLFEHVIFTTLIGLRARLDAALHQGDRHVHH